MAIEKRPSRRNPSGFQYRVRYPDPIRPGRLLSETFDNEKDARDFDSLWRVKSRAGALHELDAGKQLLGNYLLDDWLPVWKKGKSVKTRREQDRIINRLILEADARGQWAKGSIAWMQLRQVDARVLQRWLHNLDSRGVGVETQRKAVYILQSLFRQAIGYRDYPFANPVEAIEKPLAKNSGGERLEVFGPDRVEALRAALAGDLESQTLVSVMAYAGLRPGEALALQVKHWDGESLLIEQRNSLGQILEGAKSRTRSVRTVTLPKVVREDVKKWLRSWASSPERPLFPAPDGGYWNEWRYRNWRTRVFGPAAVHADILASPYTLRHVYVSLRYKQGDNPIEISASAGHSVSLSQDHYAKAIAEYRDSGPINIEAEIKKARKTHGTG